MRERLIAAVVGVTVLTVAVFAVVRAYSVSGLLEAEETQQVDRSVTLLTELVGERVRDGEEITTSFLQRQLSDGERVVYDTAAGEVVEASSAGYESDGATDRLERTRLVAGGGAVTLSRSMQHVEERVADAVLEIVVLGIVLLAAAALLGLLVARRMSRPFQDLARQAGAFGRGRFDAEVPHYSVPEAEAIGEAMREAQREVTGLVGREREFAANASHQLKTPVTALRLELEDIALWPQTHPDVAAGLSRAVVELDRLSGTLHRLLDRARDLRAEAVGEVDLGAVITEAAERWRSRVASDGRTLVALVPGQVAVRLAPGPISQILDALILDAVRHGAGDISVTVTAVEAHVRVRVSDQSRDRISDETLRSGAGRVEGRRDDIGLATAAEIAEALGGHLRVEPEPPTTLTLMLPRSRPPADVPR